MTHVHVAARRKTDATRMLERKLTIIKAWIVDGVPLLLADDGSPVLDKQGERQLDYFPDSLPTLANWNGSQNCRVSKDIYGLDLARMGRMTLDQPYHAELKKAFQEALPELRGRARRQTEAMNKQTAISMLKERLDHSEALIRQQNKEIARFQVERHALEIAHVKKVRSVQAARQEHQRVVKKYEERIAELTSQLKAVVPLKRFK